MRQPMTTIVLATLVGLFVGGGWFVVRLEADDKPVKKPRGSATPPANTAEEKSPDGLAFEFARQHHPELAALLEQLKKSAPREYKAAIADLDRSRLRLERSQERTPERYELELREWKVNSRIRLLVARMSMGNDPTLESELRQAVRERLDLKTLLLQDERERVQKRLERLDEQLEQLTRRTDDVVDRELTALLKSVSASASSDKRPATAPRKPAPKSPASPGESPVAKPARKP